MSLCCYARSALGLAVKRRWISSPKFSMSGRDVASHRIGFIFESGYLINLESKSEQCYIQYTDSECW